MSRIKISPEQVRQLSGQFKQASQESQQIFNSLSSSVNNVQGEWEGVTQQRFFQEYEQWKTSMSQFVQLLDSIGAQLDTVAARFESVDSGG